MTRTTPAPSLEVLRVDAREAALRGLRDKYERMLALRRAHDRAREDAAVIEPDPRPEMARLADDYPGSLREIDTLALDVIEDRIRRLEQAEREVEAAEPWMFAQIHFHRVLRGALVAKRWLAGRKAVTDEIAREFAATLPSLGDDARLVAADLELIAAPPRGRVMAYVYGRVATMLGIAPAQVRALVFLPRAAARRPST